MVTHGESLKIFLEKKEKSLGKSKYFYVNFLRRSEKFIVLLKADF